MIDWSATAAWITLIIAITTPAVTSVLNNRHQRKMKKIEILSMVPCAITMTFLQQSAKFYYLRMKL